MVRARISKKAHVEQIWGDSLGVIAIIGRPNVGKSTLFNRLTGRRDALVTDIPGTTRDRRVTDVEYEGYRFRLLDTGGMGFGVDTAFGAQIDIQIKAALSDADVIWLVVDGKEGVNPYDREMFQWAQRVKKPIILLVNKLDNHQRQSNIHEFHALPAHVMLPISASHGIGVTRAIEETAKILPEMRPTMVEKSFDEPGENLEDIEGEIEEAEGEGWKVPEDRPIRVALVGRPNVGKSSLINRILGDDRMIVSNVPGTTRESIDTDVTYEGREYTFIDTAGIRRKSKTEEHVEKIGVLKSISAIGRADVAVLVIDAEDEIAHQDARVASYIEKSNRAVVVAMNKWDRVGKDKGKAKEAEEDIRHALRFLDYATMVPTSGLRGTGVGKLLREIRAAADCYNTRIQTADLNRVVQSCVLRSPPPAQGNRPTKVFYGLQVGIKPPTFKLFTNHPKKIETSYTRYMINQFRYHFGFTGSPLRIFWQDKHEGSKPE